MSDPKDQAVSRLIAFMTEMNRWERKFHPLMREDAAAAVVPALRDLEPIFAEYVAPDAKGTRRLSSPTAGAPPEYDPDNEPVEATEPVGKKIAITTQSQVRLKNRFRYTMALNNESWRVEKKETFREMEGSWKIYHI